MSWLSRYSYDIVTDHNFLKIVPLSQHDLFDIIYFDFGLLLEASADEITS